MVTGKPGDPVDEVPSVVDLIAFKSQRISLYSHALEAQRQAVASVKIGRRRGLFVCHADTRTRSDRPAVVVCQD